MNLFSATVTVEITGADIPGTLALLTDRGIRVENCISPEELTAIISVTHKDATALQRLCEKRGDRVQILRRRGLYWMGRAFLLRPVLVIGMLLTLFATMYLPGRVLFIRVTGNTTVPTRLILASAEECGIGFGVSRRSVRSERMKNALLEALPQLQWAGVNTRGCVAEISVRERRLEEMTKDAGGFGHVIASMDGVILSATATRGNLLCMPGQAVAAGEVLISGYTDCGISIRAEGAQGEIFAATRRKITAVTPDKILQCTASGGVTKKISLFIGKKRINLWKDSGIWDSTCDRMYEEYYITLPGGFQLPMGWSVERFTSRSCMPGALEPDVLRQLLVLSGETWLKGRMISGTIRERAVSFEELDGSVQMTGEYSCVEMIGFPQRLEIGETNGENN